jgi:hypothetical protein
MPPPPPTHDKKLPVSGDDDNDDGVKEGEDEDESLFDTPSSRSGDEGELHRPHTAVSVVPKNISVLSASSSTSLDLLKRKTKQYKDTLRFAGFRLFSGTFMMLIHFVTEILKERNQPRKPLFESCQRCGTR